MKFLPRDEVLSLEESLRLVKIFTSLGVTKLRVTGGEPLVRKNITWLFEGLSQIEDLKEIVLTTNGSQLAHHAHMLKTSRVKRINISLDSLDHILFKKEVQISHRKSVLVSLFAVP